MNDVFLMTLKKVKRLIIGVIGITILIIGVVMIVLPGPATVVIPIGLGVLATEFIWARRLLKKVKDKIKRNTKNKMGNNPRH